MLLQDLQNLEAQLPFSSIYQKHLIFPVIKIILGFSKIIKSIFLPSKKRYLFDRLML